MNPHPHPAEHDQQQALALEELRKAGSFLLLTFTVVDAGHCDNPDCQVEHAVHSTTSLIASCSSEDIARAMDTLAEEMATTVAVQRLMSLPQPVRDSLSELLASGEGAYDGRRRDEA